MAELAQAGILPQSGHVVTVPVRALRELVSARQQLQSKRIALINTIRGNVSQEEPRVPAKVFVRTMWRAKLAWLTVSASLQLIIETFMASIKAILVAEPQLTPRLLAIKDSRCPLLESMPAIDSLKGLVAVSGLGEGAASTIRRPWRAMGLWPRRFIRVGPSGSLGRSIGWAERGLAGVVARCSCSGPDEEPGSETAPTVPTRIARRRRRRLRSSR